MTAPLIGYPDTVIDAHLNIIVTDCASLYCLADSEGLAGVLDAIGAVLILPEGFGSDLAINTLRGRLPPRLLSDRPDPSRVTILVGEGAAPGFGCCPRISPDHFPAVSRGLAGMRDSLERFGPTYALLASETLSDDL